MPNVPVKTGIITTTGDITSLPPVNVVLPPWIPDTGTPLDELQEEGVLIAEKNPHVDIDQPDWIVYKKRGESYPRDFSYWKGIIPYDSDKNANTYLVIPRLGVIAPVNSIKETANDYKRIQEGKTINRNSYLQK